MIDIIIINLKFVFSQALRNVFLNVTEFNKTTISIVLVRRKNINVSCGKERNNLMLCANAEGPFEKQAHLNTSDHYMNEFEPDTVYYYEIETETIIVFGSITSNSKYSVVIIIRDILRLSVLCEMNLYSLLTNLECLSFI